MVGDPVKDKELLTATSSALNAQKIKTPLFIAQGEQGGVRSNRERIEKSRHRCGVHGEENESHGFHNEENQFEFYEAMDKFLAKYLGGSS